jgi:serine protease Do
MSLSKPVVSRAKQWTLAAVAGGVLVGGLWSVNHGPVVAQPAPATSSAAVPLVRGLPDFADLAEAVGPSVVNIRTAEKVSQNTGASTQEEQMLEFFRRFGLPVPPGAGPKAPRQNRGQPEERPRGVGSGFVLTSDGFIMTNAHVVDGADEVVVTLTDKREFKAKVVGSDKRTDVAVVKIAATGLSAVKIGDVNRLRVGEWVMAIGSPFGLENTVTAGIVSAKQRETGDYLPFIQTDVAINPGNSGGPLLNIRGEVVGINSQIYSRSGGFQGISFAIPIDEAVRVSEQLRANGKVTRGRIGVSIDGVTKEVAESLGLNKAEGALVRGVEPNSPAAKAGVEPGDIIVKYEGKPVEKSADLPRLVGNTAPGSKATLTVWRRGSLKDLKLTVGTFDDEQVAKAEGEEKKSAQPSSAGKELGLSVRELTADERQELGARGGVLIDSVNGAAARAGLREGDVVLGVANRQITRLKDFEAAVASVDKSRPLSLLVQRDNWAQYVVIRPSPR